MPDKALRSAGECINVGHHASWAMDDSKVAAKKFLSPATDNMDFTVVVLLDDIFHSITVADPIEHSPPEVLLVFGDTPTATSCFADEEMEVTLLLCAFA